MTADIAIGELSRRTGSNIETIRYYERIGLLPKARREKGGRFRRYDSDDIARLRFIRRARQLGFTVGDVRGAMHVMSHMPSRCRRRTILPCALDR